MENGIIGKFMHLTPQQQQLVNLLADGSWHCTVAEEFMKDDRSRISELRHLGFVFDESGKTCDRHNHNAKLKLRRLISFPDGFLTQQNDITAERSDKVARWAAQFKSEPVTELTLPPTLF